MAGGASAPRLREWAMAIVKTSLGVALIWGVARSIPATHPLLIGWTGMIGLILMGYHEADII